MNMEKLFAPYELAMLAKEKGFDEECFGYWNTGGISVRTEKTLYIKFERCSNSMLNFPSATLYQQILDWFREKHQIFIDIQTDCTTSPAFAFKINVFTGNPKDLTEREWGWEEHKPDEWFLYRTHNEVTIEAIKEAFKLI